MKTTEPLNTRLAEGNVECKAYLGTGTMIRSASLGISVVVVAATEADLRKFCEATHKIDAGTYDPKKNNPVAVVHQSSVKLVDEEL